MAAAPVWSVDPRTGKQREQVAVEATAQEVDAAVRAAHAARGALADRTVRAAFLRTAADQLKAAKDHAGGGRRRGDRARPGPAHRRTGPHLLPAAGLRGHRGRGRVPRRRDQPPRRHRDPARSRTCAATRCPSASSPSTRPPTSRSPSPSPAATPPARSRPAARSSSRPTPTTRPCPNWSPRCCAGPPPGTASPRASLGLVHGFEAGIELIRHPLVAAAGFTGSIRGGRALFDAAAARPVPIPFHGELGSLNPVVVTEAAAAERAEAIGAGLAGSMTLGVGQFCVKPGLVLVPAGAAGDGLVKTLTDAVSDTDAGVLLDHRMRDNFVAGVAERAALPDVELAGDARRGRRAHRRRRVPHGAGRAAGGGGGARSAPGGVLRAGHRGGPLRGRGRGAGRAVPAAREPHRDRAALRRGGAGEGSGAELLGAADAARGAGAGERVADGGCRGRGAAPRGALPGDDVDVHLGGRDCDGAVAAAGGVSGGARGSAAGGAAGRQSVGIASAVQRVLER